MTPLSAKHLQVLLMADFVQIIRILGVRNHQRERSFAPFLVFHSDDRWFNDPRFLHDQISICSDDTHSPPVLITSLMRVGDLDIAVRSHHADVAGVEIATGPELLGGTRTVEITLRQPGRSQHNSPTDCVVRHVLHVGIDNAQFDQRRRQASVGADSRFLFRIAAEVPGP